MCPVMCYVCSQTDLTMVATVLMFYDILLHCGVWVTVCFYLIHLLRRLSESAGFDVVAICIDASDSLFCSSITCHWQSNTGGCDRGKGSSVNLNSSERLISELPKCTVGAEVNKTMFPVPVIGPGLFLKCEKRERPSVSLLYSQGHDVERWMCCIRCRALRPIAAYPAAAVQRWSESCCTLWAAP